ncbi:tyrosine-type recombinase/integrase [Streptomyces sannanensis]|uniref:Tyrosine-type recombinase/integrase n=1 Tax=Streptomyces sannanensis TaxID=285536 RepID=A0ABP6S9H1_9ACTN
MFEPSYYKRCACKTEAVGEDGQPILGPDGQPKLKELGSDCPKLKQSGHGSWYFYLELEPGENGKRRRVRRGGHATKDDAKIKAREVYDEANAGADVLSDETMQQFLESWLRRKKKLARTTVHSYEEHINNYLIPHLGHIKRRDLRPRHIEAMYDALEEANGKRLTHLARIEELKADAAAKKAAWVRAETQEERRPARAAWIAANAALREGSKGLRKPTGPATIQRINATLSSALGSAVKKGEMSRNWAAMVELPSAKRPRALVWTAPRIEEWKRTGARPSPVMVWTPKLTGSFLDQVADDRLYALWHLLVFRGLRRGEACALPWSEVDLEGGWIHINQQIVEVAYKTFGEEPKADSVRTIPIDRDTVAALRVWKKTQAKERKEWSGDNAWTESGRVFTQEDGTGYHPDWMSRRFKRLVEVLGLPPVRLHDLRHGSATLSLLAGTDIKVVQERLGHSSRQITSDTYTSVLPELMHAEAEALSSIVPRTAAAEEKPDRGEDAAADPGADSDNREGGGDAPTRAA